MKKALPVTLFLFLSLVLFNTSCDKGGDPPTDPCAGVTVSVTGTVTNTITGQANGSIAAAATGGSGFTYSVNGGASQASGTFSNLGAGSYTITARSSSGCTGSQQFTVTATDPCLNNSITVTATTATVTPCITPGTGSITVTAGGSTGFTYSIDGISFQASNVFNAVAANAYTVTVKDAIGCTKTTAATVTATPAGPLFTAVRSVVQANCATGGCHNATTMQSGINFANDCDIVARRVRIKVRAVDQAGTGSQMPPPPRAALSAADQQKITDWVAAGGGYAN